MIKAINKLLYDQQQYGTFLVKNIVRSKRKLGLGNNFTMEDLSNELNEPTINKFPRKRIIVNRCILERALPRARVSPCAFAHILKIVETHLGK